MICNLRKLYEKSFVEGVTQNKSRPSFHNLTDAGQCTGNRIHDKALDGYIFRHQGLVF